MSAIAFESGGFVQLWAWKHWER